MAAAHLKDLLSSYASAFVQESRLLELRVLGVGSEELLPVEARGEESVSGDYRVEVGCLSPDTHLELKQLIGRIAELNLLLADGGHKTISGLIAEARHEGADGGFSRFALVIVPGLALLTHRTNSRVFQDKSVPEIVHTLLSEHRDAGGPWAAACRWQNRLAKDYPQRSYCLQYRESDRDFIRRLLAEEGIATRYEFQEEDSSGQHHDDATPLHTLVLFDDPYEPTPVQQEKIRFHRADASEEADSLTAWDTARRLRSGKSQLLAWDYKPVTPLQADAPGTTDQGEQGGQVESRLEAYDPQAHYYGADNDNLSRYTQLRQDSRDRAAKDYQGQSSVRGLTAGQWFQLEDHPRHEGEDDDSRRFLVRHLNWHARNNLPGDLTDGLPGLLASAAGQRGTASDAAGATGEQPYRNTFTAVRRDTPIAPDYAPYQKPTAKGPQTATVVGPQGEEIHTDDLGRIKIQFHWAREQDHPDGGAALDDRSSCWIRVAVPWGGANWGHQYLPRIGQEVLVEFLEGDIDRPVVMAGLYNGSHRPPTYSGAGSLPANRTLAGIKSKEYKGNGYNELLFDDSTGELRAKLSSEHGKTQHNQGYLIHPRSEGKGQPRGEGFEQRTDKAGAIRAAQGLLLSTEAKAGASGKQLDREGAQGQLDAAFALAQSLADSAAQQNADKTETGKERQDAEGKAKAKGTQWHLKQALAAWEKGSNTDPEHKGGAKEQPDEAGQQPILVASAVAGIGLATPQSATFATGQNFDQVSARDTNQSTARRWIHNVGQSISLFVQGVKDKTAIKLYAARGKVDIQAQDGPMAVTGQKRVVLTACKNVQLWNAKKEILVTSGGGYIRIANGNIDIHCPGTVLVKGAAHDWSGPSSMNPPLPKFNQGDFDRAFRLLNPLDGQPVANARFRITRGDGSVVEGRTDAEGKTPLVETDTLEQLKIEYFDSPTQGGG